MSDTQSSTGSTDSKTVNVDELVALEALREAYKESDGHSHVLALHEEETVAGTEYSLVYEVRSTSYDDDCIHVNDFFEYAEFGENCRVTRYEIAETVTVGGEEYNVNLW